MHRQNLSRPSIIYLLIAFSFLLFCWPATFSRAETKIIIADNGAGKKLIEDTLPAVALAAAGDIDYVELNVMMTSDNQLIIFGSLTLDRLSDVAELFPDRSREDGSYYVIDFSLQEIRQLRLKNVPAENEFALSLAIPTLRETLSLIRRLESILNKEIGIILEIKYPWFYSDADKDISSASLDSLAEYGYVDSGSKLYIQCFDPEELQRIHSQLLPRKQMTLPLIQLIGTNDGKETKQKKFEIFSPYSYDWLYTNSGLKMISSYAAAISLPGDKIIDDDGDLLLTDYIAASHKYGLAVFVTALDNQSENLPPFADTFFSLLTFYLQNVDMDGFYTDSFVEAKIITDRFDADKVKKDELPEFFSSINPPSDSASFNKEEKKLSELE
ncbi:MAG: hypothetical protein BA866_01110 [Desulfobulbaceae bacterium S5133MH15]|nr:MAG: hypothetical protein BA866_01110 [Desulfobulbaceae bacterium S5133MH15]